MNDTKELIRNTNAFERRILGKVSTEGDINENIYYLAGQIYDHLDTKGKRILEFVCNRYMFLSEDLDIVEE